MFFEVSTILSLARTFGQVASALIVKTDPFVEKDCFVVGRDRSTPCAIPDFEFQITCFYISVRDIGSPGFRSIPIRSISAHLFHKVACQILSAAQSMCSLPLGTQLFFDFTPPPVFRSTVSFPRSDFSSENFIFGHYLFSRGQGSGMPAVSKSHLPI